MTPYSPRFARHLARISRALWFVPAVMAFAGVLFGVVMPGIDSLPGVLQVTGTGWMSQVMDSAPAGAQQVLATSAGALATVLGVAFSLTLVTLQLATGQYTPRLVGRLLDDRVTKVVLGSFIGTVAYLLLVLRAIHGVSPGEAPFVPRVSMALGLLLILGCLGLLAYFVNHLGSSIQAASLASRIAEQTVAALEPLGEREGEPLVGPSAPLCPEDHGLLCSDGGGYVQLVDSGKLAAALPEGVTHGQVLAAVGDFVLLGQPLLAFWPPRPISRREEAALLRTIALGEERTEDQDVLYGVRLLADIGLKALSPGMNDETTALTAVNQLGAVLAAAARAGDGAPWVRRAWRTRTVVTPSLTFRRLVEDAFGGLIRFAGDHPRVLARIAEVLGQLAPRLPQGDGRAALLEAAQWVERAVRRADFAPHERRLVAVRLEALRGHEDRPRVDGPHAMQ